MKKLLPVITFVLLSHVSCVHQHSHKHDADESKLDKVSYTRYSDKSELFVEFDPLIKDSNSQFVIHVTLFGESFKALDTGTLKLTLQSGTNQTSVFLERTESPGIFRLNLIPTNEGIAKLIFDIHSTGYSEQFLLDSLIIYADPMHFAGDNLMQTKTPDVIFTKEQSWKIEFAIKPVKKQSFSEIIKTNGQLLPAPSDERMIIANASGIISFTGIHTLTGTEVKEGVQLFNIAGGELTNDNIDAIQQEAKANYDKLKMDYERASALVKEQIISLKEFQEIALKYRNADIEYKLKSKNYSRKGISVIAPESGYIKTVLVLDGQYVSMGTPLLVLSKNKSLLLQANVSQRYFNKLSQVSSANFKTMNEEEVYSTTQLNGRIITYGKSAAAHAPFIPIIFEIKNNGKLISGSVVEVYLKTKTSTEAMVIPVSSLIEEQGHYYVYVQLSGEGFEKREVKVRSGDGQSIEILSGLREGERIVTKGAYSIKLASATGSLPVHGHEH